MDLDKAVRFQVIVNGEIVTTAGYEDFGTITLILSRVLRDPDEWPDNPEMHEAEAIELNVGGMTGADIISSTWYDGPIKRGDEITIRVLGAGDIDEPIRTERLRRD